VPGAEVRRVTFALVAILAAVVLQTALLDRLPFPGGSAPNLVLVLVVTLALASGPTEGMLIGFGAGLALDIAPPASNLLGLSALVFCVIGYGCGRLRGPLERIPSSGALDRTAYRVIAFIFPLWTFAVIAGAIWAEKAWGRYWGWDPKETWSFIAWVVYAGYLHARATPSVKRNVATLLAVAGFAVMMVNLFVINFAVSGLHSYAGVG